MAVKKQAKRAGASSKEQEPKALREPYSMKIVDLRKALNVAPATMSDILNEFEPEAEKRRGVSRSISPAVVRKIIASRGYQPPKKARRLSFMIGKGGNGKTTLTRFVAQRLSSFGERVLVIDTDTQGNLTSSFNLEELGFDVEPDTLTLFDVLEKNLPLTDAIVRVTENLHIVPSTPKNSMLDQWIDRSHVNQGRAFHDIVAPVLSSYDYIFFDCAPALSRANSAAIGCSDLVILPVIPDKFSLNGLETTLEQIKKVQTSVPQKIVCRVVFNRFDAREATSVMYLGAIASDYKALVFRTMIRTSADLKNAVSSGNDLFDDYRSSARADIDDLARELLELDKALAGKKPATLAKKAGPSPAAKAR